MIAEIQTRETGLSSKFEEAAPTTAPIALVFPVAAALVDDPAPLRRRRCQLPLSAAVLWSSISHHCECVVFAMV
jgi:hypothetical protein